MKNNKDIQDILKIIDNAKEAPGGMSIGFYNEAIQCLGRLGMKIVNGDKMVELQLFVGLMKKFIDYTQSNVATKPQKDNNLP